MKPMRGALSRVPLLLLGVSVAHAGDGPIASFEGTRAREYLGVRIAGIGDVDGDGHDDLLIAAPAGSVGGAGQVGYVVVYSGRDGSVLRRRDGAPGMTQFGNGVAGVGDLNDDDIPDFAVSALATDGGVSGAGAVFTFSGADGSLLWQKLGTDVGGSLGRSLRGAGDVNDDGHDDVIAGAPFENPGGLAAAGSAYVWSGADGSELFRMTGENRGDQVGWSVEGLGDMNDDGHDDFAVASPHTSPNNQLRSGSVWVYSGADGQLLFRHDGTRPLDYFGFSLTALGDANGDTIPDLAAGSPNADPQGREVAGSAYILSGDGGAILFVFHGEEPYEYLGSSVAGVGDQDGDGLGDLAVGAPHADPGGVSQSGEVHVFSGNSGRRLRRIQGSQLGGLLGFAVAAAGDVNDDGLPDLIVAEPNRHIDGGRVARAGAAHVYAGGCVDADEDGWGTGIPPFCELGPDCDDSNPGVNPAAAEIPGNGIDDDCDPTTSDGGIGCSSPRRLR